MVIFKSLIQKSKKEKHYQGFKLAIIRPACFTEYGAGAL